MEAAAPSGAPTSQHQTRSYKRHKDIRDSRFGYPLTALLTCTYIYTDYMNIYWYIYVYVTLYLLHIYDIYMYLGNPFAHA